MLRAKVALLCGYVALAIGCGGGKGVAAGSEQGACYPNSTCDPGLTCLSRLCVRLELDGGDDANTGTAGGGGDTGTGGSAGNTGSTGLAGRGGSTGSTGMAGGGGRAGTGGTGGTGGTFPVAPHPPLPQVANYGGPVLTTPKVRPIFFVGDTDEAAIKSFLSELAAGSYWPATTSEYGVGPLTVLPAISKVTATTTLSDDVLRSALAANTTSTNPPWGPADPSTIYFFAIPSSITLTVGGEACCTRFGGYHDEAIVNGVSLPYVVACACPPDFIGPGWSPLDERTAAMSHELVEAATDPFPRSDPAFAQANQANLVWSFLTGGELADMCVIEPTAYFVPPGATSVVQRSWSNAAAKLGHDPCVPAAPSIPYFNSMPVLDVIPYGTGGYATHGLLIPIGSSRTIDLDLFSAGAVPHAWDVAVFSYEDLFGGTPSLSFSLDRSTGQNGDVLRLTITTLRTNPTIGVNPFLIYSTYGATTDVDYRSHVSMGLVTTN